MGVQQIAERVQQIAERVQKKYKVRSFRK